MGKVIYDPKCPYCVAITRIVGVSRSFDTVPFRSEEAQEILQREFSDPGFTFYLVEEEKIYFGDRAAQRIAEKLYRSETIGKFFMKIYPYLSKLFSVLSRRTEVRQPECSEKRCQISSEDGGVIKKKI